MVLNLLRQGATVKAGVAIQHRKADRNLDFMETVLPLTWQVAERCRLPRCRYSEIEDGAVRGRPNSTRSSNSSVIVRSRPGQRAHPESRLSIHDAPWLSPPSGPTSVSIETERHVRRHPVQPDGGSVPTPIFLLATYPPRAVNLDPCITGWRRPKAYPFPTIPAGSVLMMSASGLASSDGMQQ